jgi:PPP family 3-phenylpropionic acid transporter
MKIKNDQSDNLKLGEDFNSPINKIEENNTNLETSKLSESIGCKTESLDELNEKAEYEIDSSEYKKIILTLKILYFLSGFTSSSWGRLSTIFYTIKGLTPSEIGFLDGLILTFRLFTIPMWGYVSDKTRNKKGVFIFCSLASTISLCAFASDTLTNSGTWVIYLIAIITAIFTNSEILSPYAIEVLGKNSSAWGDIRVWMAISWGIGSFIFSFIYDYFREFKINFALFFIFNCINLLVMSYYLPNKTKAENLITSDKIRIFDVLKIFTKLKIIGFVIQMFFWNACFVLIEKLSFIYILKELEGPVWMTGTTVLITVIFEIPIFFKSKMLIKNYDYFTRLSISMLAYLIRIVGYISVNKTSVLWIMPFEITHGITYAFMAISLTEVIREETPKHLISMFNSIFRILTSFAGNCFGVMVGGYIMEKYSGHYLFICAGFVMLTMFVIHNIVKYYFVTCNNKSQYSYLDKIKEISSSTLDIETNSKTCLELPSSKLHPNNFKLQSKMVR